MKKVNFNKLKANYKNEALREVQLLRNLQNPHIIKYYNSFFEKENLYIIMEYAEKGDLHKYIKQNKEKKESISEETIWFYAFQICLGVGYLHSQKIIHRDLKCMNILLTDDNTIKIGDLGVARMHQSGCANISNLSTQNLELFNASKIGRVGTPLYLSPEVVKQQPYDYKIDSWAIGCCLFQMAALGPPFIGENVQQLGTKIVSEKPKNLPQRYSEKMRQFVIDSLLQKDANHRPYITQILKKPNKYFNEEVILKYRQYILPQIKSRVSCSEELDFIYQVLIDANQFQNNPGNFRTRAESCFNKEQPVPQLLNNEFSLQANQSRYLNLFPNQQRKTVSTISNDSPATQSRPKTSQIQSNKNSYFTNPKMESKKNEEKLQQDYNKQSKIQNLVNSKHEKQQKQEQEIEDQQLKFSQLKDKEKSQENQQDEIIYNDNKNEQNQENIVIQNEGIQQKPGRQVISAQKQIPGVTFLRKSLQVTQNEQTPSRTQVGFFNNQQSSYLDKSSSTVQSQQRKKVNDSYSYLLPSQFSWDNVIQSTSVTSFRFGSNSKLVSPMVRNKNQGQAQEEIENLNLQESNKSKLIARRINKSQFNTSQLNSNQYISQQPYKDPSNFLEKIQQKLPNQLKFNQSSSNFQGLHTKNNNLSNFFSANSFERSASKQQSFFQNSIYSNRKFSQHNLSQFSQKRLTVNDLMK